MSAFKNNNNKLLQGLQQMLEAAQLITTTISRACPISSQFQSLQLSMVQTLLLLLLWLMLMMVQLRVWSPRTAVSFHTRTEKT